jgi:hypothetical protein
MMEPCPSLAHIRRSIDGRVRRSNQVWRPLIHRIVAPPIGSAQGRSKHPDVDYWSEEGGNA